MLNYLLLDAIDQGMFVLKYESSSCLSSLKDEGGL